MDWRSNKVTRRIAIAAALVLFTGAVVVLADQLTPNGTIFNGVFQLGPATGTASNGAEAGITNILHSSDSDPAYSASPDWADIMQSTGSTNPGGDDRNPATPRGAFNPNSSFGGEGAFVSDDVSGGGLTDFTTYVGTGNKNSGTVPSWTWSGNSVPSKDDVSNAYTFTKTVPGPAVTLPDGTTTTNHKLIFVGIEREVAAGDSHVDIEFFQGAIGLAQSPPCPNNQCTFTGSNTPGDILVTMDFTNGGAFGSLTVYRRHDGVNNNYDTVGSITGEGCKVINSILNSHDAGSVCGFNDGGTVATGGWASFDLHENPIYSLPTNQFTEYGVDVTGLGLGVPCLATVEVKSRSSQSFTASLKDFALHPFQACTATARTEIHTGNTPSSANLDYDPSGKLDVQGTTQSFNTTVHDQTIVTGQLGAATPTGSVTFSRYSNATCSGTPVTETVTLTQVAAPTAGTPGVAAADSSAVTPSPGAAVSWNAVFTPAPNSVYTKPVNATPACETMALASLQSQIITQIQQGGVDVTNTAITNGQAVSDVATVSVLPANTTGAPTPTGTVTWNVYANATCAGTPITTLTSSTPTSSGSGKATFSVSYTPSPASGAFVCFLAGFQPSGTAYQPSASTRPEPICAFPNAGEDSLK